MYVIVATTAQKTHVIKSVLVYEIGFLVNFAESLYEILPKIVSIPFHTGFSPLCPRFTTKTIQRIKERTPKKQRI